MSPYFPDYSLIIFTKWASLEKVSKFLKMKKKMLVISWIFFPAMQSMNSVCINSAVVLYVNIDTTAIQNTVSQENREHEIS